MISMSTSQENSVTTSSRAASVKTTNPTRRRGVMDNTTDLSLLEFLDIIGAALDSSEGWDNSEDLWVEYAEKVDILNDRKYMASDWYEVGPAMKGLAVMIRAGVFK